MDYILCRQCNLEEIGECKVVMSENVSRHSVVEEADSGGEEDEEDKGRAEDEVVEADKVKLL